MGWTQSEEAEGSIARPTIEVYKAVVFFLEIEEALRTKQTRAHGARRGCQPQFEVLRTNRRQMEAFQLTRRRNQRLTRLAERGTTAQEPLTQPS